MNHANRGLKRILKVGWVLILVLSPALPLLVSRVSNQLDMALLALLPAWILWGGQQLYYQWDRFYLFANRAWLWLTNSEVSWTMSVELRGALNQEGLETILSKINRAYPDATVWENIPSKKIIRLPSHIGGTIRLQQKGFDAEIGGHQSNLLFEVSDFYVPFRRSNRILDHLIALIGDAVEPAVESGSSKYTFKVRFGEHNPYFGLFVRRLHVPDQELIHFHCEFIEHDGTAEGHVEVSEERLSLTTQSLLNLKSLSERYVTLAAFDFASLSRYG